MAKTAGPTKAQVRELEKLRREWVGFRQAHLYTQGRLAEELGISKRTVQYIESGKGQRASWLCAPRADTAARFNALKKKLEPR